MFVCPTHGNLDSEWCGGCGKIVKCDCSDIETGRFKDLLYDYKTGTGNFTVYFSYCDTCGDFKWISHDL